MVLGPRNADRLQCLRVALAAGDSDLICMAEHLVASQEDVASGLCLAIHVLHEVEVRQRWREWHDTAPGPRQPRSRIASDDSLNHEDVDTLGDIRDRLIEIKQNGTRETQGLADMVLLKVDFLLELQTW